MQKHFESAIAVISIGVASHRKNSNAYTTAKFYGFEDYEIFVGARAGKYATDGTINVLVELRNGKAVMKRTYNDRYITETI